MREITDEQILMRIFIGESDRWGKRPLWSALLEMLRRRGLAGATVLRAVAGFGASSVMHTAHIERLSQDLPLVIEVVDTPEHVDAVLPEIDRMMRGGLVTMERVRVIHSAPDGDPASRRPSRDSGGKSREGGAPAADQRRLLLRYAKRPR